MASPDSPRPCDLPDRTVVRVRDAGELVATVPVLLGFHPEESLVLVATGGRSGRRLGLTVRVDLPPPGHAESVAQTAVRSLLLDSPAGAAVIVVDGRSGADPPARDLVDRVVVLLDERGVDVHTVLWVPSTAAGARWGCYDRCGCTGVLPDPSATPLAATAVAGGQVVYADRAELEQLVRGADDERIRRREALLIRALDRAVERDARIGTDAPVVDPTVGTALVDAAIDDAAAGRLDLDDDRVLALATALLEPAVRDAAALRCAGAKADAAAQLWAALARETPDPEAAEPAALLAVSALLRGDGALANVALDRAEQAWPGHRLTQILRTAADMGMRPGEFRACLRRGVTEADDLWLAPADRGTRRAPQPTRRTTRRRRRSR